MQVARWTTRVAAIFFRKAVESLHREKNTGENRDWTIDTAREDLGDSGRDQCFVVYRLRFVDAVPYLSVCSSPSSLVSYISLHDRHHHKLTLFCLCPSSRTRAQCYSLAQTHSYPFHYAFRFRRHSTTWQRS